MSTMGKKTTYFPGLNALRAIAAFGVMIPHIEQFKSFYGFRDHTPARWIFHIAQIAVTFFFVLSGFLITHRLLSEKEATGTVSVADFRKRRAYRILPLYFLLVTLAFFVIPRINALAVPVEARNVAAGFFMNNVQENFWGKFALYALMLPNIAYMVPSFHVTYLVHTWAIGAQEHFYLLYPSLLKRTRSVLRGLLLFLVAYLALVTVIFFLLSIHKNPESVLHQALRNIAGYLRLGRYDTFAIGGVAAYIMFQQPSRIMAIARNKFVLPLAALATLILACFSIQFGRLTHEVYAVFFSFIILCTAANSDRAKIVSASWINYLGGISYGIYMYHLLAIGLVGMLFRSVWPDGLTSSLLATVCIHGMTIAATIILSHLSYRYFESRFPGMKEKFVRSF